MDVCAHFVYTPHLLLVKLKIHGSVLLCYTYSYARILHSTEHKMMTLVLPQKKTLSERGEARLKYNNFDFSAQFERTLAPHSTIFFIFLNLPTLVLFISATHPASHRLLFYIITQRVHHPAPCTLTLFYSIMHFLKLFFSSPCPTGL